MTDNEAIDFLKNHQPMPNDIFLNQNIEILNIYEQVRKHFLHSFNKSCVPLFLNSFGDINGFGVYQLVEDVILRYEADIVLPHLIENIENGTYPVKYWCTQIAALFPDNRLIESLKNSFNGASFDLKYHIIIAMGNIENTEAKDLLISLLTKETNEELVDLIKSYL